MNQTDVARIQKLRWNNFILNARERKERRVTLESKPPSIMLPTGRRCNLQCKMCIDRSNPSLFKDFSFDEFLQLAPDLEFASSIAIYGWGEPFMNPAYDDILSFIAQRYPGLIIHISTNGTLLSEPIRKRLLNQPNIFLNISINAATRETYHHLMGVDAFDKVMYNLSSLIHSRRQLNSRFPVITLSFVIMRQNYHEIPLFFKLAKEHDVDDVLISDLMLLEEDHFNLSVDGLEDDVLASYMEAKRLETPDTGPSLTQFTDMPYLPVEEGNVCLDPWESIKIGDDGNVSICCYANRTFGNILEQSISEIWNSEDVKHYRATVNTENPPEPCRACPKKRGLLS